MHARYWALWCFTHLLLVFLLYSNNTPYGDVDYYFDSFSEPGNGAMSEYPVVGLWLAQLVFLVAGSSFSVFTYAFIASCFLIDAIFFWVLLKVGSLSTNKSYVNTAALFWAFFSPAVGHVAVLRLDLLPALAVGAAALALHKWPQISAFFLAGATMMKLWPGILITGLVSGWRNRMTYLNLASFAVSIIGFAIIISIGNGVQRLLSPLGYQSERGLQIESIAATPFMFLRELPGTDYSVEYAASKSYEIYGSGVDTAITITSVLFIVVFIFAAAWAIRAFLTNTWNPDHILVLWLLLIVLLMVANKVFSPQYMMWLGPLMAVILLRYPTSNWAKTIAALIAATAIIGQVVYPYAYDYMLDTTTGSMLPVLALVLRNVLVVVLTGAVGVWLFRLHKTTPSHVEESRS